MRKVKPRSIYPPDSLWTRIKSIADATNNVPTRTAVRLLERSVTKWERRQREKTARTV